MSQVAQDALSEWNSTRDVDGLIFRIGYSLTMRGEARQGSEENITEPEVPEERHFFHELNSVALWWPNKRQRYLLESNKLLPRWEFLHLCWRAICSSHALSNSPGARHGRRCFQQLRSPRVSKVVWIFCPLDPVIYPPASVRCEPHWIGVQTSWRGTKSCFSHAWLCSAVVVLQAIEQICVMQY